MNSQGDGAGPFPNCLIFDEAPRQLHVLVARLTDTVPGFVPATSNNDALMLALLLSTNRA